MKRAGQNRLGVGRCGFPHSRSQSRDLPIKLRDTEKQQLNKAGFYPPAKARGGKTPMQGLLKLSRLIDGVNQGIGKAATWLVLVVVVISAGNAVMRYAINWSSNGLLEIQWYLFSAIFMLCASYVLLKNEHIRIDVIAGRFSARTQNLIDVFGILVFLLPMVLLTLYLSWPVFMNAWHTDEMSPNPGGLIRWPVRLLMPIGFFLLTLQGLSELIKRLAFLTGNGRNPLEKEKSLSAEEELAAAIKKHKGMLEVPDIQHLNRGGADEPAREGDRK
jgi:TRAP-type mannitol/chloroaromatic compound transport system permease small subunit